MGKFDIFVKMFWKHLGKRYKITFALNSSISSFCFSQNVYCLSSSLGSDMRFCAQTALFICLCPLFLYLCHFLGIFVSKDFCPGILDFYLGLPRSGLVTSCARTEIWLKYNHVRSLWRPFSL